MFRRPLALATWLAPLLSSSLAIAQTATVAPPSATRPDAPIGKTTEDLEAKLASMQQGGGLTADQAAQRAMMTSVEVAGKRRSIAVASAQGHAMNAQFIPKLDLSARYTRLSNIHPADVRLLGMTIPGDALFPIVLNNYQLAAALSIPLSDYVLRLSNSMAAASHNETAARLDEQATRLAVARDARVAYYQWIRAQDASYVAAQALEAARGHAFDAKNAFNAGLVSRADLLRAESQVSSAQLTVARYDSAIAVATEQLRVAIGDGPNTSYEVGENILVELPAFPVPLTPDAGYAEAFEHRLEVKQLGESEASLRNEARVARAGNLPRLDAQAEAIYANPNSRYIPPSATWHGTWNASLILSWTPSNIFGSQANAHIAEAHAEEVAWKRAALKNALRLEVNQAMNALTEARVSLTSAREGLLAAEENYRVRRELYRAGKATAVEVTDAETDLTRSRLEVVNSHVDERVARVALIHALGRDRLKQ